MDRFDLIFGALVRLTGWGMGVFVVVTGRLDPTATVALILAFVGFEILQRGKNKNLPSLLERKRERDEGQ